MLNEIKRIRITMLTVIKTLSATFKQNTLLRINFRIRPPSRGYIGIIFIRKRQKLIFFWISSRKKTRLTKTPLSRNNISLLTDKWELYFMPIP